MTVTSAELASWMRTLAPEHFVPDPPRYRACTSHLLATGEQASLDAARSECETQYTSLKEKTLAFLISSHWLIGEAAAEHVAPVETAIRRRLVGEHNGVRLLVERELAVQGLDATLRRAERPITREEIAHYYAIHIGRFERRERRYFDIIEYLHSEDAARALLDEIEQGRKLPERPLHEVLDRPRHGETVPPEKRAVYAAIFAARTHVYLGPVPLNGYFAIFRVTRVAPRSVAPLVRVEAAIQRQLTVARHRRALASFLRGWQARWIARTYCRPGFVAPGCRDYKGGLTMEEAASGLT